MRMGGQGGCNNDPFVGVHGDLPVVGLLGPPRFGHHNGGFGIGKVVFPYREASAYPDVRYSTGFRAPLWRAEYGPNARASAGYGQRARGAVPFPADRRSRGPPPRSQFLFPMRESGFAFARTTWLYVSMHPPAISTRRWPLSEIPPSRCRHTGAPRAPFTPECRPQAVFGTQLYIVIYDSSKKAFGFPSAYSQLNTGWIGRRRAC